MILIRRFLKNAMVSPFRSLKTYPIIAKNNGILKGDVNRKNRCSVLAICPQITSNIANPRNASIHSSLLLFFCAIWITLPFRFLSWVSFQLPEVKFQSLPVHPEAGTVHDGRDAAVNIPLSCNRACIFAFFYHALANFFIQPIACLYLSLLCHKNQNIATDNEEQITSLPPRHPKPVHPLVSAMVKGSIKSQISQLVPAVNNIVIK